ncbi:unnamed protein product [Adineta ricciae]|uniref:Uncharacterized protein n=1 Tax=Adineta ricciae TaxID=249248 RepID=A0A815WPY8_ADIRI|nr:unnamed protein product [Adineta ricciae]CAF1619494.1 unnamed protein product [Adineta ricciae]
MDQCNPPRQVHIDEYGDTNNSEIPLLNAQLNSLANQLRADFQFELSCLKDLNQWRKNTHKKIHRYSDRKYQQCKQFIQTEINELKKKLNQIKRTFDKLTEEQRLTKELIDSMKEYIRIFKQNINVLMINEDLINIPNDYDHTIPQKRM